MTYHYLLYKKCFVPQAEALNLYRDILAAYSPVCRKCISADLSCHSNSIRQRAAVYFNCIFYTKWYCLDIYSGMDSALQKNGLIFIYVF